MAQVGRISGPLLFSNLERNGKNIDFRNQTASVPTLKLDVNNNYIGINKTAPAFALDIGGSASLNFDNIILTSSTPGNFSISNDDITVFSGDINLVNPVVQSENRTLQTRITGTKIDTYVSNASLTLDANGTGAIEFLTNTNVDGTLHTTGDISLEGNVILGDSAAVDKVSFNADVDSSIIPDLHNTHDFGRTNDRFDNLYAHTLYNSQVIANALTVNNIDVTKIVGNIFWVSPNGDNNNKGDHPQSPWKTLSYALQAADSSIGGPVTIHLEAGEYQETFPMTVPEQVSVYGEDMRNVIISPTTGTESENAFLLNDSSTIQNITIKDFYYDSVNDKGYAFAFAPNASISSRSPYVFNTTVLTKGQVTTPSDPRGYDSLDAGRAVKCDGAVVDTNSPQASMLFYSMTAITPGVTAVKATNGVRMEWLNSFVYFAKEGIRVENGSTGRIGPDGSTVDYGGELRCINSANIYGEKGIIADGSDALVYIVEHTFSYAGTGKRSDNDTSFVTEKFETTELNNGKILGTHIDKDGGFNVGDVLFVNQETGDVEFKSVDFDFSDIAALTINTDGSVVTIDGEKVQTDLIRFRNNIVESTAGPLNFAAAPLGSINIPENVTISADLDVSGNLTIGGALVRLGDADTDSIDFNAEVNNNIIPNLHNTYNLGSTSKYWGWLYSSILLTDNIVLEGSRIRTTDSDSDLELTASGTGNVAFGKFNPGQTFTVSGTSTFNNDINTLTTMAVTGDIDINGNARFFSTGTDNLNANSNVSLGDVHFIGNRITTLDTNSDLEFRPHGTGLFRIVGDLEITNRLLAPGANYTLTDVTMEETSAGHLVVQRDLTIQGMSINESVNITGNVIESNVTNADLELRATGTGKVIFQENLQVDNDAIVNGNMALNTVNVNNFVGGTIITTDLNVPSFNTQDLEFTGNFITTTTTNADLELGVSNPNPPTITKVTGSTNFVRNEETNPRGITFNNDGTKMFIVGTTGDDVNEYTLSTGFDLTSTVTFLDSYSVSSKEANPTAVKFNADGTKMFITGVASNNIHEYALSTGFDVSTASFTQTLVTSVDNDHFGLDFSNDGTKMYITGNQNDKIYQYDLSSAFDISTATFNQDLYLGTYDIEPFGIEFSPNGKRLFIVGTRGNGVDEFRLTTGFDISTATHEGFYFTGGNPSGIHISPDGLKFFIVGNVLDTVQEYTTDGPYRIVPGTGTGVVRFNTQSEFQQNLTTNGDTTFVDVTADTFTADNLTVNKNISMPSNMKLEGVDFIGNTITTYRTNDDLDLRASGTGVVRVGSNTNISGDLTVNGTTTFDTISSGATSPNKLIVGRLDAFQTQLENINISGNKIQTTQTNSNLELGASGTGVVRFEGLKVPNLTVNNTLSTQGITVNADVEFTEIETSSDILFNDNYITTTESNSNLELRGNADGRIHLNDIHFKGNTLYANRDDSTIPTLEIRADKFVMDSTDSITLPKGTFTLNEDSTANADIRYDTSIDQFVGKEGGLQRVFGGIYSNDLQTRVRIDSNNNAIFFDVNGVNVMEMNSIGETYAHRIELQGIDIDGSTIQTNNTNGDIILLPEGGTGRTQIEAIQFLDRTIYTTGTNIGTLAATGLGYIKFNQDSALRVPIGTSAEREPNPEVGSSRYNTDLAYLENYTAGGWVTAAGTGAGVSEADMNEIMNEFILIFG